ncbi:hypothetical protein PsorP6_008059 [Peronosclerospora sorghi]|uniref:Uncharacterized protein n=1 Tax=Peronosclerospora sorghi TaxID=230839 RepID=A0ACC0W7N5_9STRA|nr:hypothetical protein PsorP6_008059 [Peronosclerospora sorghi]
MLTSHSLSFYRTAPQDRITLNDFEELGHKRIELLSQIQARWTCCSISKLPINLDKVAEVQDFPPNSDADIVSHYALRLAFCRVTSDWEWFVSAEARLLAARLSTFPPFTAVALLASEGIKYEVLNEDNRLLDLSKHGIYRVPFMDAPDLVKTRDVLVRDGFCLIPLRKMKFVAIYRYQQCLENQMRDLQCAVPAQPLEFERLTPILDEFLSMARSFTSSTTPFGTKAGKHKLQVAEIDRIAEKHFPLCMKHLHRKLREHHHLKYDGRVQYRMFLKGAGVGVNDCIEFFRTEFVQKIPAAKFDKEYAYHIRHSYGLEGSRKDYAPLSCEQIMSRSAPGHGQYHGCPFKHWGQSALQKELRRSRLSLETSTEIMEKASTGHCQSACRVLLCALNLSAAHSSLETLHANHSSGIIMHPNAIKSFSHVYEWLGPLLARFHATIDSGRDAVHTHHPRHSRDPQPQHEPDTTFLDNRKRPSMFRTLSSYDDTPVRTVWRDTVCSPNVASALRALCGSPPPRGLSLLVASKRDPWTTTAGSDPCVPGRRQLLRRANSTNSIYLRMGTLEMPDQDATLHCVATVLSSHLAAASSRPPVPLLPCLCPHVRPARRRRPPCPTRPACELAAFIKRILKLAKTDAECIIMTLVSVERLLTATRGRLEIQRAMWLRMVFYYRTWR